MKTVKIFALLLVVVLVTGCFGSKKTAFVDLEKELTEKATAHYKQYYEGKVSFKSPVVNHQITLDAMEKSGVDIKNFVDKKCDLESYALVTVEFDEDGNQKDGYTIKNYLTCGDYETAE
jgi:hypothetical protein